MYVAGERSELRRHTRNERWTSAVATFTRHPTESARRRVALKSGTFIIIGEKHNLTMDVTFPSG